MYHVSIPQATNTGRFESTRLHITARMYIAAPVGRLGLRGAAARRSATWPFALVGLRATSHTCDSLYAIAQNGISYIVEESMSCRS